MMRGKENKEKWRCHVREHEASGLTQPTFCKERNLLLNSFSYHRALYLAEMKKSDPRLSPLKIIGPKNRIF